MKTLEDALAAIETMKADHEAEKASILKKNKELIEREKLAKTKADEAAAAAEEAATEAASKAGDVTALRTQLETKHTAELKKLADQLSLANADVAKFKIDAVISDNIAKAGVLPQHTDILTTFLKNGAKMENGEATVDGVPLSDHISTFFASDAAKHYIAAPQNSGSGATGSTANASNHGFTKENIKGREGELMALEITNPALFKQAAIDSGRTDLL